MSPCTVIAVPGRLMDQAVAWSMSGLAGEVAWLAQEHVQYAADDAARQGLRVRIANPGAVAREVMLTHYLAEHHDVAEVRVVWVRSTDAQDWSCMESLADFLADTVREQTDRLLVDLVSPCHLDDSTVPSSPQGWRQVIVSPEDVPDPSSADAGWSHSVSAVHLHTALAVAGCVGGRMAVDWVGDGSSVTAVHAFSRLILGGANAVAETERFLDTVLPEADAADIDPEHFASFEHQEEAIEHACRWIVERNPARMSYVAPPPSAFAQPPRLSVSEHLRAVWSCLWLIVGRGRLPELRPLKNELLESTDQGHFVGPAEKQVGEPLDWASLDAECRRTIDKELTEASVAEGVPAGHEVWQALTELATSLVDGGELPADYPRAEYRDHRLVVGPRLIGPTSGTEDPGDAARAWRELRGETSRVVLVAALARLHVGLRTAADPIKTSDQRIMRTANRLAVEANTRDRVAREAQEEGLPPAPEAEPPTAMLDRLRSSILGDFLSARLDAERWREGALAPLPDPMASWRRLVPRARGALGFIGMAAGGLGWLRHAKGEDIDAWTQDHWGWSMGDPAAYLLVAGLAGLATVVVLGWFARAYNAAMERIRRSLELRLLLRDRAVVAFAAHRDLEHADRIIRQWCRVLESLYPLGPAPSEPAPPAMPILPRSVRIARPDVAATVIQERMVAPVAGAAGWRGRAISELMDIAVAERTPLRGAELMSRMYADDGMPGGLLATAAAAAEGGEPWRAWRAGEIERVADDVRRQLAGSPRVEPLDPPSDRCAGTDFLGAIAADSAYRPRTVKALVAEHEARQLRSRILWTSGPGEGQISHPADDPTKGLQLARVLTGAAIRIVAFRFRRPPNHSADAEPRDPVIRPR